VIAGRRFAMLVPLLLASPALALGSAFETQCAEKIPMASCSCMVQEIGRTSDGRIMLEASDIRALPKDRQQQAMLAMLNRYGLKPSDLAALKPKVSPMFDAAWERCK
jgi:hypothetical protein